MECYCVDCGQYTTRKVFSDYLCADCHDRQDSDIEAYEQAQARKYGYAYGWSED